ncbi:MAG: dihydrolipoamide acetyltransferase family protein [Sphingobacteriales bacterium]|jgi:2-oxoglutarate dehydrogenase E2 component (dihydrolipoamide succinyltransferase)
MPIVDMVMPKMGESIMEATILRWHKKPGDRVSLEETVLEIATDKVDTEVPSTAEGNITEILYAENDVVPIGSVIARIQVAGTGAVTAETPPAPKREPIAHIVDVPYQPTSSVVTKSTGARFYSPLVMNIAQQEGISLAELENIIGTGNDGRVSKKDILDYIANRSGVPKTVLPTTEFAVKPIVDQNIESNELALHSSGNVEIIEMDRMRRLIAEHMIKSKATSAHVTSFVEVDVTQMVMWRERNKKEFEKREGEKITFTPLMIEAVVKCLKIFPWLNSSVEGSTIILKKDINIGMATALPSGNLIVPVIKNADQLNLVGLTKRVNGLAYAARNGKLRPDDTQGGTFTFTNVGTFGSLMGTPIINQPQVAILAAGAIKKRPVVIETKEGDTIGIRHMMYMSMSYDHRIIDGGLGSTFLSAVAKELEQFDPTRTF